MIEVKDELTLSDDKDYVVASKVNYDNKTYLFLVETNNPVNTMFCLLNNDEVEELKDKELIKTLIPLFTESAKKTLEELKNTSN